MGGRISPFVAGGWVAAVAVIPWGCAETDEPRAQGGSAVMAGGGDLALGRAIYEANCLLCHGPDGLGVAGMHPPLAGSAVVTGDPGPLAEVLLRGIGLGEGSLPASGDYEMVMARYDHLGDRSLAALMTYLRGAWGNDAAAVTAGEVEAVRERIAAQDPD